MDSEDCCAIRDRGRLRINATKERMAALEMGIRHLWGV
jgi:hypothetical protein